MRHFQLFKMASLLFVVGSVVFSPAETARADTLDELSSVRGVVHAVNKAIIASELVALIKNIPFREGQAFKRGDVLIAFDCRRYNSELKSAAAEARAAELTLNANLRLQKHNAIGSSEVEISRARFEETQGRMEALAVRTSQCEIKAPYDGRIVTNHIHAHEMPKANEPLVEIVGDTQLEVDLLVPSNWLAWLKAGEIFYFLVDETNQKYAAKVDRIAAIVDPISQTVRLNAIFLDAHKAILPGMSGTANFTGFKGSQKISQGGSHVKSNP